MAGLALIDSSHPDMHKRLPAREWFTSGRGQELLWAARWRLTPLGLARFADDLGIRRHISDRARRIYPPDVAAAGRAFMLSSRQRRADVSELAHVGRSCNEGRACLADLGTLPLAVITSSEHDPGHAPGSRAGRKRSLWYISTWSVLQAELAELSRHSSHTVAKRAGHYIHRDDPGLVAGILRDLAFRAAREHKQKDPGREVDPAARRGRHHDGRSEICADGRRQPLTPTEPVSAMPG